MSDRHYAECPAMEPATDRCFFHSKFKCEAKKHELINVGSGRIQNIIRCRRVYDDGIHEQLGKDIENDKGLVLKYHKSCVYVHFKQAEGTSQTETWFRADVLNSS